MCIWVSAYNDGSFVILPATSLDIMLARFMGSLMMHINVEKELRMGLSMMKYVVNHPKNFTNAHAAFFLGYLTAVVSILIEVNCMIIMITLPNILDVIGKYISLVSIVKFP